MGASLPHFLLGLHDGKEKLIEKKKEKRGEGEERILQKMGKGEMREKVNIVISLYSSDVFWGNSYAADKAADDARLLAK